MLICDSNVWIALFNKSDANHEKALLVFDKKTSTNFFVTDSCMIEVVNVLNKKGGKDLADNFLTIITDNKDIDIFYSDKDFTDSVISFYQTHNLSKLSFVDQCLLYLSQDHPIITFDKELEKAINNI